MKYKTNKELESNRLEKLANKLLRTPKQIKKFKAHSDLSKRNNKYIQELRRKATPTEVIVGKWLITQGIYFIFQKGFFKPFHRIVDFYLPRRGIVEIDGGYHNNTKEKDDKKDYLWGRDRYLSTVRITNEQVLDGSFIDILLPFIGDKEYQRDKTHQSKYPKEWNI